MKKVLGIIAGIVVIIYVISSVKSCYSKEQSRKIIDSGTIYSTKQQNEEIEKLQEELEKYKQQEIINEQEEISMDVEDNAYLIVKFPSDGNYYKEAYDRVTFYSDSTCTEEIDDARFMSPEIDKAQAKNGLEIFCLRLDNGRICYCTESPYLITEKKYNELKTEDNE